MVVVLGRNVRWSLALLFSVWMIAIIGSYYLWYSAEARSVTAALAGVSSAAAILVGIYRYRPPRPLPWLLLAGALFAYSLERTLYAALRLRPPLDSNGTRAIQQYVLQLLVGVFIVTAFFLFSRQRNAVQSRTAVVDTAIVVLGYGLLTWALIAQPWDSGPGLSTMQVILRNSFVLRDVIITASLAGFVTAVRWSPSVALLAAGILSLLAYGSLVRLELIDSGGYRFDNPVELLFFLFFVGAGASALSPSMSAVGLPNQLTDETNISRLVLVAISALIPFALLLASAVNQGDVAFKVVATTMFVLVLIRLTAGAVRLHRSLLQATIVRDASAEFVAAADLAAIEAAVADTSRRLLARYGSFSAELVSENAAGERESLSRSASNRQIAEAETADAGGAILRIPLAKENVIVPSRYGGVLQVKASAHALAVTQGAFDVIAAQTSLAVDRIQLTEQVSLTRREAYFRALVQNSPDVILILEPDTTIRYASPSAENLFGAVPIGQRLPHLVDPSDRHAARELLDTTIAAAPRTGTATIRTDWRIGVAGDRHVEVSCQDLRADKAINGVVVTLRDVTDRRRLEQQLTEQAFHDPLTGLGNRSLLMAGIERAMTATDGGSVAAIFFVDLDDFKIINDGFGHPFGDAVLRDVAARITTAVGPPALAARVGGDEFAVLVDPIVDTEIAATGDRLIAEVNQPVMVADKVIPFGASIGVATTIDAANTEDLLGHADLALYEAKKSGKHAWRRYDPTRRYAVLQRLEIRNTLSTAISGGGVYVNFQPIIDLGSRRTVGFEALLLLEGHLGESLTSAELFDLAEDAGLASEITALALALATREAADWKSPAQHQAPFVSVNVNGSELQSPNFTDTVLSLLHESGLAADRLMLEIKEGPQIPDDTHATAGLRRLRQAGVRIAIDNFGTGWSTLSNLQRIPIDALKLDFGSIDINTAINPPKVIVSAIVDLATTLRIDTFADGLESAEDYRLAKQAGCAHGQGNAISAPLSPNRTRYWIESQETPTAER